jgi:hypothetical protein
MVSVEDPPAATEAGLKPAVAPEGSPVALNATDSVSPPDAVVETVVVTELPWTTEPEAGLVEIEKSGVGAVSDTIVA